MAPSDIEVTQAIQHLLFRHSSGSVLDDGLCSIEKVPLHDRFERTIGPDPHVRIVPDPHLFQLVRDAVPDIVADVLWIGEDLVDPAPRPRTTVLAPHMP